MSVTSLLRVALNVSDLVRLQGFYVDALGFAVSSAPAADPNLARMLGVRTVQCVRLQRGGQTIKLCQCDPPGAPYPAERHSNDLVFQHLALTTDDIDGDYRRLCGATHEAISRGGPQLLPGGTVAYKFRDPDGHPLELICLATPNPATRGGIDHTAISVADTERSVAFYRTLGLGVAACQQNTGPAQDALDGLDATVVDVVALALPEGAMHVELLGYRHPVGRAAAAAHPADIAASRMVVGGDARALVRDPDGHLIEKEAVLF